MKEDKYLELLGAIKECQCLENNEKKAIMEKIDKALDEAFVNGYLYAIEVLENGIKKEKQSSRESG